MRSLRKTDYSFSPESTPPHSSINDLARDFCSFLANFENIDSLTLMTLNEKPFIKSRFFMDKLKHKCRSLVTSESNSAKSKIKMRVLILEREADLSSPGVLYLRYEPLLSSVLGVDFLKPVKGEKTDVRYDDSSKLYQKYRYAFLQQVMEGMPNELKEFKRKYKSLIDRDSGIEIGRAS